MIIDAYAYACWGHFRFVLLEKLWEIHALQKRPRGENHEISDHNLVLAKQ